MVFSLVCIRGWLGLLFGVKVTGTATLGSYDLRPQVGSGTPEVMVAIRAMLETVLPLVGEDFGIEPAVEGAGLASAGEDRGREGVVSIVEGGVPATMAAWYARRRRFKCWGCGGCGFGALAVWDAEEIEDLLWKRALWSLVSG